MSHDGSAGATNDECANVPTDAFMRADASIYGCMKTARQLSLEVEMWP